MLFGGFDGELELRRQSGGGARLRGKFPYGRLAVLSDGGRTGRPRKERIRPRAFAYRVEKPDEDIHLLVGHSYDAPLASKLTNTLKLVDSDDALTFEAFIAREIAETSYGSDILKMVDSGLVLGVSPGFRIPPARAVPIAEEIEEEADEGPGSENRGAIIRNILQALLYEFSLVTRPAYPEAQIAMRDWTAALKEPPEAGLQRALNRWRA